MIESFLKHLIRTCVNSESLRFVLLDSQTIKYVNSPDPMFKASLVRWGKYFPFHLLDYILWPVHCENHWRLCLGSISNRSIYWFDPYTPGNHRDSSYLTNSMEQKVLKALNLIMFEYSQKNKASREWKFLSSRKISDCYNLPVQTDGSNCGLLVFLYAWCFLAGDKFSSLEPNMDNLRKTIGGMIAGACGFQ